MTAEGMYAPTSPTFATCNKLLAAIGACVRASVPLWVYLKRTHPSLNPPPPPPPPHNAGHNEWRPKQPGQRGLRILSFDGGGTRGVLSVALLKQVMERVGKDVFETFDVICGTRWVRFASGCLVGGEFGPSQCLPTHDIMLQWRFKPTPVIPPLPSSSHPTPKNSTGGILAVLFGIEKTKLAEAEALYDRLVAKIFASSPLIQTTKLLLKQSYYDEVVWEQVLQEMLGTLLLSFRAFGCLGLDGFVNGRVHHVLKD